MISTVLACLISVTLLSTWFIGRCVMVYYGLFVALAPRIWVLAKARGVLLLAVLALSVTCTCMLPGLEARLMYGVATIVAFVLGLTCASRWRLDSRARACMNADPELSLEAARRFVIRVAWSDLRRQMAWYWWTDIGSPLLGRLVALVMLAMVATLMAGGLVSGVWLGVEGEWELILLGVFSTIAVPRVWPIAAMPLFLAASTIRPESRKGAKLAIAIVGCAYSAMLVCAWCMLVFHAIGDRWGHRVPVMLWAYAMITGPMKVMSKGDVDGALTNLAGFILASAAFLALLVMHAHHAGMAWRIAACSALAIIEAAVLLLTVGKQALREM